MGSGGDRQRAGHTDPIAAGRLLVLEAELRRLLPLLVEAGASRVVLYGSACRGEVRADSDLDLLVVMPPDAAPLPVRLARLYGGLAPRVPCDILAYTPAELRALAALPGPVAQALAEGRTVYQCPPSDGP